MCQDFGAKILNFFKFHIQCWIMARTKFTIKKTRLPPNPFNKVNAHDVHLLDVQGIRQACIDHGKVMRHCTSECGSIC